MSPPTVALLAQGYVLAGVAVLLRQPVARLLARPRIWAAVAAVGTVTMTAFLWHLTALYLAVLGLRMLGIEQPEPATAAWWLTRPAWLLVLALLAVGLIAVFRHFDSSRRAVGRTHASRGADVTAALGAGLAALGILMVSVTGVDAAGSTTVRFVAVGITPAMAMAALAAGVFALVAGRSVGGIASARRTPIPDRTSGPDRQQGRHGPVPGDPT
jgi:hypothetical protein